MLTCCSSVRHTRIDLFAAGWTMHRTSSRFLARCWSQIFRRQRRRRRQRSLGISLSALRGHSQAAASRSKEQTCGSCRRQMAGLRTQAKLGGLPWPQGPPLTSCCIRRLRQMLRRQVLQRQQQLPMPQSSRSTGRRIRGETGCRRQQVGLCLAIAVQLHVWQWHFFEQLRAASYQIACNLADYRAEIL